MATPFLGEIRTFSFSFAPKGWALCNGQTLPIQQNSGLFSLLGTYYGGNGTTNFMLPNLQGNVPIDQDLAGVYPMGQAAGTVGVTLTSQQIPPHTHVYNAATDPATVPIPTGATPVTPASKAGNIYTTGSPVQMSPQALAIAGGSQPHNNLQPYLVVSICIALNGIFPSRG